MKFIKGARTWRSILGTQTFFWPLTHPPTHPPWYSINQPLSKGLVGRGRMDGRTRRSPGTYGPSGAPVGRPGMTGSARRGDASSIVYVVWRSSVKVALLPAATGEGSAGGGLSAGAARSGVPMETARASLFFSLGECTWGVRGDGAWARSGLTGRGALSRVEMGRTPSSQGSY